jgi:hypothetical protein
LAKFAAFSGSWIMKPMLLGDKLARTDAIFVLRALLEAVAQSSMLLEM